LIRGYVIEPNSASSESNTVTPTAAALISITTFVVGLGSAFLVFRCCSCCQPKRENYHDIDIRKD